MKIHLDRPRYILEMEHSFCYGLKTNPATKLVSTIAHFPFGNDFEGNFCNVEVLYCFMRKIASTTDMISVCDNLEIFFYFSFFSYQFSTVDRSQWLKDTYPPLFGICGRENCWVSQTQKVFGRNMSQNIWLVI